MISVLDKIINSIKEFDSTLDVGVGSNFRDLVITPMEVLLNEYEDQVSDVLKQTSAASLEDLSFEELQVLARNYLLDQSAPTPAVGKVRFYYATPQLINIPANTKLQDAAGNVYTTLTLYAQSALQVELNGVNIDNLYSSGEISVVSVALGPDQLKQQNDLFTLVSSTSVGRPRKITAVAAFTGGLAGDTTTSLVQKLKDALYNKSLSSIRSFNSLVPELNSNILDVYVAGAGDSLMTRDLLPLNATSNFQIENFLYVEPGQEFNPYAKGHIAYVDTFTQVNNSGLVLSSPANWTTEFTTEQYRGISKLNDILSAEKDHYQILSYGEFTASGLAEFNQYDGKTYTRDLVYPSEISIENASISIGLAQLSEEQVRVPLETLNGWIDRLSEAESSGNLKYLARLKNAISSALSFENSLNLSPVISQEIPQHVGIDIDVQISTTDTTELGEMCYVTVLRNTVQTLAHDGYGLAYKKQPEYLIRIAKNTYSDLALKTADLAKFTEEFNADAEALGLLGTLSNSANSQYWYNNIYLVDNNILQEEVFIPREGLTDFTGGVNQFLQAGKYWIEPDIAYDFKIKIYETLATQISIKPSSSETYTQVISKGANYPNYLPSAGEKITEPSGVEVLDSSRGAFGIGISETRGEIWTVSSLFIRSFIQTFPMQLFRFNITSDNWSTFDTPFTINWYGYGYDPDVAAEGSAKAFLWNPNSEEWEDFGVNLAYSESTPANKLITSTKPLLSTYMESVGLRDYVTFAVSANNFDANDHSLVTEYIELTDPLQTLYHVGNCMDIWCWAPSEIITESAVYTIDPLTGEVLLEIPYLCDITEVLEANSQLEISTADYRIFNLSTGSLYGPNTVARLVFISDWYGAEIEVTYKAWTSGNDITSQLNSESYRYPGASVEAKVMQPYILNFNYLKYGGGPAVQDVKDSLKEYINTLTGRFEKSDLVQHLYSLGVTYVDLDMDITYKKYENSFYFSEGAVDQTLDLPDSITKFYTDYNYLTGVISV